MIQGTIEGAKVSYCINPERWAEIKRKFNDIFDQFENPSSADCC